MMKLLFVAVVFAYYVAAVEVSPLVSDPYGGGGGGGGGGGMPKPTPTPKPKPMPKAPIIKPAPKPKAPHGSTGVGKAMPAAPVRTESPIAPPIAGGWPLPTEPTESLRIPLPMTVEDPYSSGGMPKTTPTPKTTPPKTTPKTTPPPKTTPKTTPKPPATNTPKKGGSPTDSGVAMTTNGGSCASFADANYLCSSAACTSKVAAGSAQPNYQCAEFVARTIASTGKISGLTSGSPQSAYGAYTFNGKVYDLLWTSHRTGGPLGLEDYLLAAGWKSGGSITDCSVVFVNGAGGAWGHVAVGVGADLLDAHNNARLHVKNTYYTINAVYNK